MLFVVGAGALTGRSGDWRENGEALRLGAPFFSSSSPLLLGPHTVARHGALPASVLASLLDGFAIPEKNKKFFDDPSVALFHCLAPLRAAAAGVAGADLALYLNVGPANTRLDDFLRWAGENEPEGSEPFTSMMASSVVKLLPNVVVSNVSMNLDVLGENTFTSGGAVGSAWALGAAARALEDRAAAAALVGSASFPLKYFNVDAFLRFFGPEAFEPPPCEGASAVFLVSAAAAATAAGVLGALGRVATFKAPGALDEALAARGFDPALVALVQPSPAGNFLAAGEPLGALAVLTGLEPSGTGLSVNRDWFGNVSVVEVFGPEKALSLVTGDRYTGGHDVPRSR